MLRMLRIERQPNCAGAWLGKFSGSAQNLHRYACQFPVLTVSLSLEFKKVGAGRGSVLASNIFISTSLLYLASEEVGCVDESAETFDCDAKIHGFRPSSLITNIAVITGLLSAFANPVIGAIVDYTDYRHATGLYSCIGIIAIQAIQVYTVSSTWFAMAILQAIAGFLYQIVITTTYAYFPELSGEVGEKVLKNVSPKLTMLQFGTQAAFLVVIIGISIGISSNDVVTAQISQGINTALIIVAWGIGWRKLLPKAKAKRSLPEGKTIWGAGFTQLYYTAKHINTHYKRSIRWYLLALCFAEAGAQSFTVCAVTYLNEVIKMDGTEIGIVFLVVLCFVIVGAKISEYVVKWTDYNTCWRLNMLYFSIVTAIAVFVLKGEEDKLWTYILGCFWGIAIGWFYPTENGFFAVLVPQEQATEMAGIFNFSSLIISWFPPFLFTAMNESGIALNYGLLHLVAYFLVAIGLLSLMPSWEEVLVESHSLHASQRPEEESDFKKESNVTETGQQIVAAISTSFPKPQKRATKCYKL
jgi:MFS-type transporter involved in bile tolerance (Atg22 family)